MTSIKKVYLHKKPSNYHFLSKMWINLHEILTKNPDSIRSRGRI